LRTVVVTGAGTVNPLGSNWRSYLEGLSEGRSGIGRVSLFDPSGCRSRLAAEVRGAAIPSDVPRPLARRLSRSDTFALTAAIEAVREAALETRDLRQTGIVLGATVGGMLSGERAIFRHLAEQAFRFRAREMAGFPLYTSGNVIAQVLGLRGPRFTVSTACTSSANALALAADMIREGRTPVMLAGGSDSLCMTTYAGFNALHAIDPEPCRPFDRERQGLTLGEGAAVLVLEDAEHARARGAAAWVRFAGYGMSSDAHHMTAPRPDGAGAILALRRALAESGVPAEAIDYVNAHGTGTRANDPIETQVLKSVLGRHAYRIPVSSTKSMIGHCLGAAGALEALASVLALRHGVVPPTLRLEHPDSDCDLDYVPGEARRQSLDVVVSNLYGFGGTNTSLVFARGS
jgi:3-oxoacyl-[acyl-carrier-protein] synthase II